MLRKHVKRALPNPKQLAPDHVSARILSLNTRLSCLCGLTSASYVWQLFVLDERLSRFSGGPTTSEDRAVSGSIVLRRGTPQESISFESNPRLPADFAVPSANNPRFLVETKDVLGIDGVDFASLKGQCLRTRYPGAIVLVVPRLRSQMSDSLAKNWDYVFDNTALPKLTSMIADDLRAGSIRSSILRRSRFVWPGLTGRSMLKRRIRSCA